MSDAPGNVPRTLRAGEITLPTMGGYGWISLTTDYGTFDGFVAAMQGGLIVLNIHTDAFNPGEISGRVGGGDHPAQPGTVHRH